MGQVINTNTLSLNAQRNLNKSQGQLATALERLSSGLRINSAKDDAAGLAISERFTTQIRGLNQAVRNANDGISFAQTAEGALSNIGDSLQRVRELAVQSANDTNSAQDRQALNNEVQQLIAEVGRIADSTEFNGQSILDGTLSSLTFQVGANQGQTIAVDGVDARTSQLGAEVGTGDSITASDLGSLSDDLTINGADVDLSGIGASSNTQDIVNEINAVSADSGVFASVASEVSQDLTYTSNTNATSISINNVTIDIAASTSAADTAALINDVSAQTGLTAEESGGTITLTSNGSSIDVSDDASNAVLGLGAGGSETYLAGIQLSTDVDGAINVQGTDASSVVNNFSADSDVLGDVNVLTRESASDALQTLDFALQQVSGLRAELGAVQTRFESTIDNLSIVSENLSAARSRIQDADFAAETANLTKAQVLQQAGTSVLAQANATSQNVLALLQ
jgi:flagellin